MTCTPSPTTAWPGSGGRANRRAYVSLPRKYRPLMKEKNSPSDAPSGDRSAAASANDAFGESACFARRPLQLAGESRNMRWPPGTEVTKGYRGHKGLQRSQRVTNRLTLWRLDLRQPQTPTATDSCPLYTFVSFVHLCALCAVGDSESPLQ